MPKLSIKVIYYGCLLRALTKQKPVIISLLSGNPIFIDEILNVFISRNFMFLVSLFGLVDHLLSHWKVALCPTVKQAVREVKKEGSLLSVMTDNPLYNCAMMI